MGYVTLLLINAFFSWLMTGLMWYVQLVHYPSFLLVKDNQFQKFHQFHTTATSSVVMLPMVLEMVSALFLIMAKPQEKMLYAIFVLLVAVWSVTFFVSVPAHNELAKGYNENIVNHLIGTNWIRTISWTLKSVLLAYLLMLKMK
jgi:hypothetical protein